MDAGRDGLFSECECALFFAERERVVQGGVLRSGERGQTYSTYGTQSDTAPGNVVGNGADEANYYTGNGYSVTQSSSYNSSQNYLTAVGSFTDSSSYYGTYDQSGDVFNWIDTTVDNDYPVLRGGDWSDGGANVVSSSGRYGYSPRRTRTTA